MAYSTNLIHDLFGPRPRILILRGAYLGDFLLFTPALRALRQALPGATIGVIVSPSNVSLAARYPAIDEVFVAPAYPEIVNGPVDEGELRAFFAKMRAWQADIVLQLNDDGRSANQFAQELGPRLSVGIRGAAGPDLDLSLPEDRTQSARFRHLDVLALLGIRADSLALDLPLLPTDDADLAVALPEPLSLAELDRLPLACIHPGAKWGARRWPAERFAQVADRLVEEFGLRPVVIGTEQPLGKAVAAAMRAAGALIDLTGSTSLGALIAVVRRSQVFIGNDSGPSHVAEALGIPSVVIYGVNHPLVWGPSVRAWHRIVADWTAPCRWFRPDGCSDDSSVPCLQAVTAEHVLAEVRSLLQARLRIRCLRGLSRGED